MDKNIHILFINVEEISHIADMGLSPYKQWIAEVTGLPIEQISTINAADGDLFPNTLAGIDGIIGGGSGHQPYEKAVWIKETGDFLRKAHYAGIPQLLNCFCHQVFAASLGGSVELGKKERRFGLETVHLTSAGKKDLLFLGLPSTFELFTSHSAVITKLPEQSTLNTTELAITDHYPYESLAYGTNTRTLQCHPELQGFILTALAKTRTHPLAKNVSKETYKQYLEHPPSPDRVAHIEANGRKIFNNWLENYVLPYASR